MTKRTTTSKDGDSVSTVMSNRAESPVASRASRRDDLLGKTILLVVTLATLGIIGFFINLGYHLKAARVSDGTSIVSIQSDKDSNVEKKADVPESAAVVTTEKASENATPDKGALSVLVLNGGAPKGSAAVVGDMLKSAGFAKTSTGNSVGDYSGLVVYRADGSEAGAEAVKAVLSGKYPSITIKAVDPKNAETSKATIVVIFGK